jgi:HAD superfamily hydrolase (TIGR01490 family)
MGQIAAVFDVDKTLVQGSTERLFFWYLMRRQRLKVPQALAFLGRLTRRPGERFRDKSYLKGMEVEETIRLARQCYEEEISSRVSSLGLAHVQKHRALGHKIVLLTGSLSFLVEPLKDTLGAEWLIATELARNNHCFTGEIAGLHPRGENKWLLLRELSQAQGIDLPESYAYGDHIKDISMLRGIGHPVVVNPSLRLRCLARKYHWPIYYF